MSDPWKHKKSGRVYELLGPGLTQCDTPMGDCVAVAVYRGSDGQLWARLSAEFFDRFEPVDATPPQAQPASEAIDCPAQTPGAAMPGGPECHPAAAYRQDGLDTSVAGHSAAAQPAQAVVWVNHANLASAKIAHDRGGPFDQHTWNEHKTDYHDIPMMVATPPADAQAITNLSQQEYDALVRDAMNWRAQAPAQEAGEVERLREDIKEGIDSLVIRATETEDMLIDARRALHTVIDRLAALASTPEARPVAREPMPQLPLPVSLRPEEKGYMGQMLIDYRNACLLAAALSAQLAPLSEAARDVLAERRRQITTEDWTPEHDDEHEYGELSKAAACLAVAGTDAQVIEDGESCDWWGLCKKHAANPRQQLVIAGALILAEIERLDRGIGIKTTQHGDAA